MGIYAARRARATRLTGTGPRVIRSADELSVGASDWQSRPTLHAAHATSAVANNVHRLRLDVTTETLDN